MLELRSTNSTFFLFFYKIRILFFFLYNSGQILSSRVVSREASVMVKENKLFSFYFSPKLLYGDRCG